MSPDPARPPRVLRWVAARMVRGRDASFILADLDELYARDREAGAGAASAAARYVLGVARSVWATASLRTLLPVSGLDVRLGVRMLAKHPVVSAVAVLSMVVGIPVGLAPVLIEDSLAVAPPFVDGDRLVGVRYVGGRSTTLDLQALAAGSPRLGSIGAFRRLTVNVAVGEESVGLSAVEVSRSVFRTLGTAPVLGRTFVPTDHGRTAPRVVVVGHELWQTRLGGDPGMVGRTIEVAGVPSEVIGVMPEGFSFPDHQQLWLPLDPEARRAEGGLPVDLIMKRPDGVEAEAIEAEVAAVVSALRETDPERYERVRPEVAELTNALIGLPKGGLPGDPFWVLTGLLALSVLLVASVNIGLLMYARSVSRRRQTAIRSALGATRARIVGQVFAEALVLSLVSAGLGVWLLDRAGHRIFETLPVVIGQLPGWVEPTVTPRLVVRAVLLAVASAAAASVIPAWRATARMAGGTRSFGRITSLLVITDVAVAIAVAGLVVGVLHRIDDVRVGQGLGPVPDEAILAVGFLPQAASSADDGAERGFGATARERIVRAVEAEPGVLGVAVGSRLPRMSHAGAWVETEGSSLEDRPPTAVQRVVVTPGYFEALGVPVLRGRSFEWSDSSRSPSAIVVNETFADSVFGGEAVVGRSVRTRDPRAETAGPWLEIVGVVPDAGVDIIDPGDGAAFYEVAPLAEVDPFFLGIRVESDPARFSPRVRELGARAAPQTVFLDLGPLETVHPDDWHLMIGFGIGSTTVLVVLLALVMSGVYAILSFAVASRRQEFGVRRALGATAGDLVATISALIRRDLLLGAALGTPAAIVLYRVIIEDPAADLRMLLVGLAAGLAVLFLVGGLGALGPARSALAVAPSESMKP